MRALSGPFHGSPVRRLAVFGLAFALAILSCGRDVTGPNGSARYATSLSFAPVFPPAFQTAGASSVVSYTRVHVVLHHSDGTVALDKFFDFATGDPDLTLQLPVDLLPDAPASGEPMTLTLEYLSATDQVVFSSGTVSVTAAPPAVAGGSNPPVSVPLAYTGPGSTAKSVSITSPTTLTVLAGGTFAFTATAIDQGGNPIDAPIIWSSAQPTIANVASPAAGTGAAGTTRGTATITAQLLTGPSASATVNVTLPASQLVVSSGSGQSGTVGSTLANPLIAKIAASDGVGVAGITVNFAVALGGGSITTTTAVSDVNGLAQTNFKLGSTVGPQSVTATAPSLSGAPSGTFSATASAAVATKLVVTTQPVNGVAGIALANVVVTAQDNFGNVAAGFTGPVAVAFGNNTAGATLAGTTTVNAVAGIATFSTLGVNKNGSAYTLVASSSGLASVTTSAFDIAVGAPSKLVFTVQPSAATANVSIAPPMVVNAQDSQGNPTPSFTGSVTLALTTNPSSATLGGNATVAAVAGAAAFPGISVSSAGIGYIITASATGLTSAASSAFTINAVVVAGATHLVIVQQPTNTVAGATISPAITVQALDASNALVPSYLSNVTLAIGTNPGASALSGTATVAAVGGIATFSALSLNHSGTGYTLQATSGALTSATSSAFNITAGAAANIAVSAGQGQSAAINTALATPLGVLVTDANANAVSGVTINWAPATGGGSVASPTSVTNVNGIATIGWTLGATVGGQTATATKAGVTGSPITFNATGTLSSASKTWVGTTDAQWTTASNWQPAGVPVAGDSIVIPPSANNPVLAAGVTVASIYVNAGATLTLNGPSVALNVNGLLDATGGILGTGTVVLNGTPVARTLRGVVTAANMTLFGSYSLNGALVLNGSMIVNSGGALNLNSQALTVNGNFSTTATGSITVANGEAMIVTGNVSFGGATEAGLLTNGTLTISGNFSQSGASPTSFAPSSTFNTVFAGTTGQTVFFANFPTSAFGNVSFSDAVGITFASSVLAQGNLTVLGSTAITVGTNGVTIGGMLTDPSGGLHAPLLTLSGTTTVVSATTPTITAPAGVTFTNVAVLVGNLTINGPVTVSSAQGSLSPGGHSLIINGDLITTSNGAIAMSNAGDAITVNGNATFSGTSGALTAGLLSISGNFTQNTVATAFAASSPHVTRFTGATPMISFANPTTSNFGTLQLQTSGAVNFATNAATSFDVWVKTGTTPSVTGAVTVTVGRNLYDTTGGRWQVQNTTMSGAAGMPKRVSTNVTFAANGILLDTLIVTGSAQISGAGAQLDLNGHYMKVTNSFGTNLGGVLVMTHVNDSLVVKGNATFTGGSTTGKLTNGYFEFDGANFTQAGNPSAFAADAPHITWFWGSTQQTISISNPNAVNTHFGNLYLQDTATVLTSNIFLNGQLQTGGQSSFHIEAVAPQLVTSNGANLRNVVFDNVRWKTAGTDGNALFPSIDNVTFKNIGATTFPQFDYQYSTTTNLTLAGFTFLTTPTGAGAYINVAGPDTLTMSGVTPGSSGGFLSLSGFGAVKGWANTATWLGTTSTSWGVASNWDINAVPSSSADVVINPATNQPATVASTAVHNLTVTPGAILTLSGGNLNVNGDLAVAAGARIDLPGSFGLATFGNVVTDTVGTTGITSCTLGFGENAQQGAGGTHSIVGKFCNLFVAAGSYQMVGGMQVIGTGNAGHFSTGGTANLTLNGFRLDVTSYMSNSGGGTITMQNAKDTLVLHSGSANFDGPAETGLMTAGVVIAKTPFFEATGAGFDQTGTAVFVADTTSPAFQTLSWTSAIAGHGFHDVIFKNTASKGFSGDQYITGNVLLDVTMTNGQVSGSYNIYVGGSITDNSSIGAGGWGGSSSVHFTGTPTAIPVNFKVNNVHFEGGAVVSLPNNVTTNYVVVDNGSTLNLNGHRLSTSGNTFTTQNGAKLQMTTAGDSLDLNAGSGNVGAVYFNGGSTLGLLTTGGIVAGSIFQGYTTPTTPAAGTSATSFAPSGSHRFWVLSGIAETYIFANPGTGAAGSHFNVMHPTYGSTSHIYSDIFVDDSLYLENNSLNFMADVAGNAANTRLITTTGLGNNLSNNVTFSNVKLKWIDGQTGPTNLDKFTWTGFPAAFTGDLLEVNRSSAVTTTFNSHNFSAVAFGTGAWLLNSGTASVLTGALNTSCNAATLTTGQACPGGTVTAVLSGPWQTASTWSPAFVPDSNTSVIIPAGKTVTISALNGASNTWYSKNLTLVSTGALSQGTFDLEVHGNLATDTTSGGIACTSGITYQPDGGPATLLGRLCRYHSGRKITQIGLVNADSVFHVHDSTYTFNGHKVVTKEAWVATTPGSSGGLIMTNAKDSLIVSDSLWVGDPSSTATNESNITAGFIGIAGNFRQVGNPGTGYFNAGAGNTLSMAGGVGGKTINFADTTTSGFGTLKINGSFTLATVARAAGNMSVNASFSGANGRMKLAGNLYGAPASSINTKAFEIGGVYSDTGTFSPDTAVFTGGSVGTPQIIIDTVTNGVVIGGPTFKSLRVTGVAEMHVNSTNSFWFINGNLAVTGSLRIGNGVSTFVSVNNDFSTAGSGTLSMLDASSNMHVGGNVTFGGGSTTGLLTNGTLDFAGNFTQSGSVSSFAPSGSHTGVTSGASTQNMTFANPTTSAFENLTMYSGTVALGSNLNVLGTLAHSPSSTIGVGFSSATTPFLVTAAGLTNSGPYPMNFTNTLLKFVDGTANATFNSATFSGFSAGFSGSVLEVNRSDALPLTFTSLNFGSAGFTASATAHYLNLSGSANLLMALASPSAGVLSTYFLQTAGGTVTWP